MGMGKLNDFSSYMYCIGTLVMSTESTLERAVEQLAGCLAKETKVSSRGQSTIARKVAYPLVNI